MTKTIAVLGATGSVGRQALDVALSRGYRVDYMSVGKNAALAEELARLHAPRLLAVADEAAARDLAVRLADTEISVLSGSAGILEGIAATHAETVVNAILGEAGLLPTLAVLDAGRRLALANKESLVIAGELVMARAKETGCGILPVDSEHSAIFQCLRNGRAGEVKRLLLTASGGPFFGYDRAALEKVTLADALAHPTWKMGKKITVDSATLMNKGFEVLEASHLFGIPSERVEVVVHRESIIHSAVEYIDNTVIAEMSVPDMRACVQYAVDYPEREEGTVAPLDLFSVGRLTFARPDTATFPLLSLAAEAGRLGGGMGAVLNAADEVAVEAFLREKLTFTGIFSVVTRAFDKMRRVGVGCERSVDALIALDRETRAYTETLI